MAKKESQGTLENCLKLHMHSPTHTGLSSRSYGFSSSRVWMWELGHKGGWALKNWCFWIVMLEKTLESPLDWKDIKLVNPKGNQSWIFTGRTDAEGTILWPPHAKNWLIREDTNAVGKIEAGGQGDNRRLDGRMASLTWWTWIWAGFRSWWWTGKPWMLQSMGSESQIRLKDWTELNPHRTNDSGWNNPEVQLLR